MTKTASTISALESETATGPAGRLSGSLLAPQLAFTGMSRLLVEPAVWRYLLPRYLTSPTA